MVADLTTYKLNQGRYNTMRTANAGTRTTNRRTIPTPTNTTTSGDALEALFGVVAKGRKGPGGTVMIPQAQYAKVKAALAAVLA